MCLINLKNSHRYGTAFKMFLQIPYSKWETVAHLKTGTLTEDGLELGGVLPCLAGELDHHLVEDMAAMDRDSLLLWSLASCHSLTRIHNK